MSSNQTTGISVNLSTGEVNAGTVQFRNRIINGDMRIDQRNSGVAASLTLNSLTYCLDRCFTNTTSFTTGSATVQRVTDAPSGFMNSYKITIGATPLSGGTNPYTWGVCQYIESYNINDFQFGTLRASPLTISFWFKGNNAGEYALTLIGYNPPTYSRYTTTFTVQANVWTFVTKLIPSTGALTGTWNSTNDIGLQVAIASYQGTAGNATALNTWGSGNVNSATSLNWPSIANATIQVTGVQLEKGQKATPFEFRPYPIELVLCQRYFQPIVNWTGGNDSTTSIAVNVQFQQTMRATPNIEKVAGSTLNWRTPNVDNTSTSWTINAPAASTTNAWFQVINVTTGAIGQVVHHRTANNNVIATANAEL